MKLTASGEPFGDIRSKAEVLESIKQSIIEIGEVCGQPKEQTEKMIDIAIKAAEENNT